MNKKLLPLLLALAFAFSGCLGMFEGDPTNDDDLDGTNGDDDDNGDTGDQGDNGGNTGNGDGDETENQPPTASLSANVTSGQAPLMVKFSLEASDPDGDEISWTLDLGDGSTIIEGDEASKDIEHTFGAAGNFTIKLSVSDATDSTTKELLIQVSETPVETQTFSGGWLLTTPVYCGIVGPVLEELLGVLTDGTSVDPATVGRPFTANFTTEVDAAILEYTVAFVNTDDGFETVETFMGEPGADITGIVPENADSVYFSACGVSGPVDMEYNTA